MAILALLAAGCGGGGGGGTVTGPQTGSATVTGRVVDAISGVGVAGATITYGNTSVTSDAAGQFVLAVPAPSPAQNARISAPNYRDQGQYEGTTLRLSTEGLFVPAAATGQTIDLGVIRLYHRDDPPPPPSI